MAEQLYEIDPATILFPLGAACAIQRVGQREALTIEDSAAGLDFLARFARPASLAAARGMQPASDTAPPLDAAGFDRMAEAAIRLGVLRPHAGGTAACADPQAALAQLIAIARLAEELQGDIAAMGPEADAAALAEAGEPLTAAIRRALGALTLLSTALAKRRQGFVERQLERLADAGKRPWLHLGCGQSRLEGWYNIDLFPAELSLQLRWGLPFADGSIEYVFLAHLFEHLYKATDAPRLLAEIRRVLKPGGVVRIIVPDAEAYLRAYVEADEAFFDMQRRVWPAWAPKARTKLEAILGYLGARESQRNFAQHKYGYDFATLKIMLESAGFRDVVRSDYLASTHAALKVDELSGVAQAQVDGRYASLFVEASK